MAGVSHVREFRLSARASLGSVGGRRRHGRRCNIAAYKKIDPAYYDKMCRLFPEVHAAGIYNDQTASTADLVDRAGKKYGRTWRGLLNYIEGAYTDKEQKERACGVAARALRAHERLTRRRLEGIPLRRVFSAIVGRNLDHDVALSAWSKRDKEWQPAS